MKLNRTLMKEDFRFPDDLAVNPLVDLPEKVIQFGEGNFLRAFVDWMVDRLNQQEMFNGRIVVVQPIQEGLVDRLNEQDGLYTLFLRGIERGRVVEKKRLISAVSRGLNPYADWRGFLACAENPDLRIVISNTTEAGIAYEKETFIQGQVLRSFPAKLTAFLYHRFCFFKADPQKGMLIFPCELIDQNGHRLKEIMMRLIDDWQLSTAFKDWVSEHNHFFDTLVDRIVTGYPRDAAAGIFETLGYVDQLLDTGEIFHLWVIQGDRRFKTEFPLDRIGLNVVWTDDLRPYRERKVRVLNGAHTMTTAVAYLCGLDTVGAAVEDPQVGQLMRRGIFDEILPVLSLPEVEKTAFADSVLERFQNPFIHHHWIDIALNSISKFKTRCLPTLVDYIEKNARPPVHLSFSLAALTTFYRGRALVDGKLEAVREKGPYRVSDDVKVLEFFLNCWQAQKREELADYRATARRILGNPDLWGMDLNALAGLTETVARALHQINTGGMRKALDRLLVDKGGLP